MLDRGADGMVHSQAQVHASRRFVQRMVDSFWFRWLPWPGGGGDHPTTASSRDRFARSPWVSRVGRCRCRPLEDWELATGLLERSAENRINLLVAPDTLAHGGNR